MITEKKKRAEVVLAKIEENFLNQQLRIGDKLPSERDLANLFGVSRNSVREALQILALRGVIVIRRGGGSYVTQSNRQFMDELSERLTVTDEHLIFEMLEVRSALEVEAVSLAAQRATAEDLNNIRKSLKEMAVFGEDEQAEAQADFHFHMHIIKASHNSILIHLAETLMEQMEETVYVTRKHRFVNLDRYEETYNEHKNIYIALASGDSELAKSLMETHLSKVRKELSKESVAFDGNLLPKRSHK